MASIDFTSVEAWTNRGLTTFDVLFAIQLKTRRTHLAGCNANPNKAWIKTLATNGPTTKTVS